MGIERDGTRHLASAFLDTFVHIHIVDRIALKNTQRSDVMYGSPDRFGMLHYCKRGLHGSVSQTAASIASSASKPTCKWINHQHARKRSIYSRLSRAKRGERYYWTYIALTDCNQSSVWWVITWRLPRFNSSAAGIETFQQLRHLRNVGDDNMG